MILGRKRDLEYDSRQTSNLDVLRRQQIQNITSHIHGTVDATVALENLPVLVHQELLKVPDHIPGGDGAPRNVLELFQRGGYSWAAILEPREYWVDLGRISVHGRLGKQGKSRREPVSRSHILETVQDLVIITRFLIEKVRAREAQDNKIA